jgi:cobalt-zinc-cadmium efflux system outer membrane protein
VRIVTIHKIGWFLAVALTATCIYAETGPSTALDALVGEVSENNPELKFYEAEIAAAQGGRKAAGEWANPGISGSLGQKRTWNEENELTGRGRAGELSVTQQFEWPGRIGLRKAIADRDIARAKLGL